MSKWTLHVRRCSYERDRPCENFFAVTRRPDFLAITQQFGALSAVCIVKPVLSSLARRVAGDSGAPRGRILPFQAGLARLVSNFSTLRTFKARRRL